MMLKPLKNFAENVYVNLSAGLILLISSAMEIFQTLEEGVIGMHHGVAVFALLHILKTLPELQHGAEDLLRMHEVSQEEV